jgi:two-component system, response regulator PdtaR
MARGALRVLIVEDEPEETVVPAGHEVIGWATSQASAIALGEARSTDFAFVDLHLRDGETGLEISRRFNEASLW